MAADGRCDALLVAVAEGGRQLRFGKTRLLWIALSYLLLCLSGCSPPTMARGPEWVRGYLIGKIADGIWDDFFGKPDTLELDRRLRSLEDDLSRIHTDYGSPIGSLRGKITRSTTKDEYFHLAAGASDRLENLERRIRDLESQLSRQSEELERQRRPAEARIENHGIGIQPLRDRADSAKVHPTRKNKQIDQTPPKRVLNSTSPPSPPQPVLPASPSIRLRVRDWNGGERFSAPDERGYSMRWRLESGEPIAPLASGEYPEVLSGAFVKEGGKWKFRTGESVFIH